MKGGNPLFQKALSREITAVLLFKALALAALYFAFFASPPGDPGANPLILKPPAQAGAAP